LQTNFLVFIFYQFVFEFTLVMIWLWYSNKMPCVLILGSFCSFTDTKYWKERCDFWEHTSTSQASL